MAKKLIKKHDELSKKFLSDPDSARLFLELHLDSKIMAKCDITSLVVESSSYIDDDLREFFSDIVYKLQLKDKSSCVYVYVLVEHQSRAERLMPLRILRYQLEIIQNHIIKYKIKDDLPLVAPLVFYNGSKSPYPYSLDVRDLFSDKDLYNEISFGKFNLIDLTIMPEDNILQHKQLALLEMCLKHIKARDFHIAVGHILRAMHIAHDYHVHRSLINSALAYLINARESVDLKEFIRELTIQIPEYKEEIMSYADELRLEGMQKAQREMIQEMLKAGLELNLIQKVSHLSKKEIEKIKETMH